MYFGYYLSTRAKLVDAIIEGVLSQDKAFFEGIVVLFGAIAEKNNAILAQKTEENSNN
jgi:hypothetical protein